MIFLIIFNLIRIKLITITNSINMNQNSININDKSDDKCVYYSNNI